MGLLDKLIKSLEVLSAWVEKKERENAAKASKPAKAKSAAPAARLQIQKPKAGNGKDAIKPAVKSKPVARKQKAVAPPAKKNGKTAPVKSAGKKPVSKTRPAKKGTKQTAPAPAPVPQSSGVYVGLVTHYFPHVNAAAVKIEEGSLIVGERIHIVGHTTDFKQKILSLQIDRKSVKEGKQGEEVGIETKDRVRTDDKVYKVT